MNTQFVEYLSKAYGAYVEYLQTLDSCAVERQHVKNGVVYRLVNDPLPGLRCRAVAPLAGRTAGEGARKASARKPSEPVRTRA